LHVLGMPPAFVLSQDQTLKLGPASQQHRHLSLPSDVKLIQGSITLHISKRMVTLGHVKVTTVLNYIPEP